MILAILVAVLATVATIILWRRISEIENRVFAHRESLVARLDAQARAHFDDLAALDTQLHVALSLLRTELHVATDRLDATDDDLRVILAGIVTYLDDVPQNFAFNKVEGHHYRLRLPDRLRLELHQS